MQLFDKAQTEPITLDGKPVTFGTSRFGPYARYEGQFYSLPKGKTADNITLDEVKQLIEEHAQRMKPIYEWGDLQVLQGRYGPYIKEGDNNYRMPKSVDINTLTEEQCRQLISNQKPTNTKKGKK